MKKLLLTLFIAALSCTATFAQSDEIKLSPENEKKSIEMSRELANTLMLNEPEFIKLKALSRERVAKEVEAQRTHQTSSDAYTSKLHEIEADFEAKLQEILTPTQKKAFAMHKQSQNSELIVITSEE